MADRDFEPDAVHTTSSDYSRTELNKNRVAIVTGFVAFLVGSWTCVLMGDMQVGGAVALTVVGAIVTVLLGWLFASESSVKLDENSVGMGKDVKPRTMGTILGWLYDGFRH